MKTVVVVGLGGMGSAVLAHLAARGVCAIGVDPNPLGHTLGSSHGGSRVVRQAYFEHPDYVPLLLRAFDLWRQLEAESGTKILHTNGVLIAGGPESQAIRLSRQSADAHGVPTETLAPDELRSRYPQFVLPDDFGGLFEPGGGFVVPEFGIAAQLEVAERHGAVVKRGIGARSIVKDGAGARVLTTDGELRADHVVVCAGAWTQQLLPQLDWLGLQPQRKWLVWFDGGDRAMCTPARMPTWLIDDSGASGDGVYYGVPAWEGQIGAPGVKIGFHGPGPPVVPGTPSEAGPTVLSRFTRDMSRYMPAIGYPVASVACTYTMTPDEHFVVDTLEDMPVSVACGFSGHGFKFAPVIGEVLADLAVGRAPSTPIGFLSTARFKGN